MRTTNSVNIQPQIIKWALDRSMRPRSDLKGKFAAFSDLDKVPIRATLKNLESFAKWTHTPIGYFFLPEPPVAVDNIPISDFRTRVGKAPTRPSLELLETIFACQKKQDWYREYESRLRTDSLDFIGSANIKTPVVEVAQRMRDQLGFSLAAQKDCQSWESAFALIISKADETGILVMVNGVVQNNTSRPLDPGEFCGFSLSDEIAPLVFVNGADYKAAQIFTLAHELAHLWLGKTALSDTTPQSNPKSEIESWCNQVAAEFLVPKNEFIRVWDTSKSAGSEASRLARFFKVSTLVVLRRALDCRKISVSTFRNAYHAEIDKIRKRAPGGGGGDFYRTQKRRVGVRFARAVVKSTLEGGTLYTDAFRMLGIRNVEALRILGKSLGVV